MGFGGDPVDSLQDSKLYLISLVSAINDSPFSGDVNIDMGFGADSPEDPSHVEDGKYIHDR
jgi:hypothetical protein